MTRNDNTKAMDGKIVDIPVIDVDEDLEVPSSDGGSHDLGIKVPFAPNKPHPSLEFPPLYYALDYFPSLREKILPLYKWRWSATYPLQKRVVGSRILRKAKIYLTYGEILIFIPLAVLAIVCIAQTFIVPSASGTGKAARLSVAAALLFAQKNSYITMVLGIPFDRAVSYHKLAGYVAVVTGILHTAAYFLDVDKSAKHFKGGFLERLPELTQGRMNTSGTAILICILGIYCSSLKAIRKRLFEVFYFIHLTLLLGIVIGTAFHTGAMVPLLVFLTTGVDLIVRKLLMPFRYPREASLRVISESIVEISFPKVKGFDYNPGQYVYIAIPEISRFEWHPFSMSTAPHQSVVTLQIRAGGNWTKALHELAFTKRTVPIMMEGPYGNFGVDIMSDKRYKVNLLISGGIGLTPMQSIFSHLIHEHSTGERDLKKLKFVWIQRDPELMLQSQVADTSVSLFESRHMSLELSESKPSLMEEGAAQQYDHDDCTTLASKILASFPPGDQTENELEQQYHDFDLISEDEDDHDSESTSDASLAIEDLESPPIKGETDSDADTDQESHQSSGDCKLNMERLDEILDISIYQTQNESNETRVHHIPGVVSGRPDLPSMFVKMREEAIRLGERRVAVCVCGPKRIVKLCRKACVQLSDKKVRFDFHDECFG